MSLLIRQARVLDAQSVHHQQTTDIYIENGTIRAIGNLSDQQAREVIEGEDIIVSPGFVDILADYREPGLEHKETIKSGLSAAAAGGFTHVCTVPNTQPAVSSKATVKYLQQQAAGNAVSLHPLGAISRNIEGKELAEMMDMRAHGAIAFTDGWAPVQNANLMLKALEYVKAFEGTLLQIPVETTLSAGGLMHEGIISTRYGMPGIPTISETLLVHRDLELLRYTSSRLHITGISAAQSVDMIREAKKEGLQVTCSVTPYHLVLTDEALRTYNNLYKVVPPLRTEADRQALIAGIKDGTIDCIASHHRPQEWDAKAREFEYAGVGMNVQEIVFPLAWQAIQDVVSIERLAEVMSRNPRAIFGLPAATIATDTIADLTIYSIAASTQVKHESFRSLSRNNPFIGAELKGAVTGIYHNNQLIKH